MNAMKKEMIRSTLSKMATCELEDLLAGGGGPEFNDLWTLDEIAQILEKRAGSMRAAKLRAHVAGKTTPPMTQIEFEIMRAESEVKMTQKQLDDAIAFAGRMSEDLTRAVEQGWDLVCPANNLANAAAEVSRISERLTAMKNSLKTLKSLVG
jgi:hypothetical protein